MLTLKPSPLGLTDDYIILDSGKEVGRIYKYPAAPAGSPSWFWGNLRTPNLPGRDRGWVNDFELAKAAFMRSWKG